MPTEYRRLVSAIFFQMLKDWEKGKPKTRKEIMAFMQTRRFTEWAEALGLNPDKVRAKVEGGQFDAGKLRAIYR